MGEGFNWDALGQYKQEKAFLAGYPDNLRTFWSPRDQIHEMLVELLQSAQHSIVTNMYGYDDAELDSIIRTKMLSDHVYVQMSLDKTQAGGKAEKELLAQWPSGALGTSVAVGQSARHAISHLKICIVDGIYTVRGSTNWSLGGEQKQDNELTLCRDPVVAAETRTILDINHTEMLRQMAKAAQSGTVQ